MGALLHSLLNLRTLAVSGLIGSVHNAVKRGLGVDVVQNRVLLFNGQFGVIEQIPRIFIEVEHIIFALRSESVLNALVCLLHTYGDSVHVSLRGRVTLLKAAIQQSPLLLHTPRTDYVLTMFIFGFLVCLLPNIIGIACALSLGVKTLDIHLNSILLFGCAVFGAFLQCSVNINTEFVIYMLPQHCGIKQALFIHSLGESVDIINYLLLGFRNILTAQILLIDILNAFGNDAVLLADLPNNIVGRCPLHFLIGKLLAYVHRIEFCLSHDVVNLTLRFLLVGKPATGNDIAVGVGGVHNHTAVLGCGGLIPGDA